MCNNIFYKFYHLIKKFLFNATKKTDSRLNNTKQDVNELLYFHNLNISEIMIPRADTIAVVYDIDYKKLKDMFIKTGFNKLLVYENSKDNIVGYVSIKDFIKINSKDNFFIKEIIQKPFYAHKSIRFDDLLLSMKENHSYLAVILDEYGGVEGIVTEDNILNLISDDIKTIKENTHLKYHPNKNTFIFDARTYIQDIEERLNITFSDNAPNYDTLGGFILSYLNRIPKTGEKFSHPLGIIIEILEANSRKIIKVKLSKIT